MAPKQTDPQFKLRLTPDLKARVETSASQMGRSLNSEILHRLESSFDDERDAAIRVVFPEDLTPLLAAHARAHERSISGFILEAVERQIGLMDQLPPSYSRVDELISEIETMEGDLRQVADARDAWRHLYEQMQKTGNLFAGLLSETLREILDNKDDVPAELAQFARRTRSALNTSLTDLFDQIGPDPTTDEWDWSSVRKTTPPSIPKNAKPTARKTPKRSS